MSDQNGFAGIFGGSMQAVISPIAQLFLMLMMGFIVRKTGVIDKNATRGMSSLLLKLTLPAMIFASMQRPFTPELFHSALAILALAFAVYVLYFIIALTAGYLIRAEIKDLGVYQFVLMFSNVGFMGFPVLQSVFGQEVIFYAAMFNVPFHFFVFTLGVVLMTMGHKADRKFDWKLLVSPGIIATLLGFIFFFFRIPIPGLIFDPLKIVGDVTVPFSMICVGSMLTELKVSEVFSGWRIYLISFLRLVFIPVIVYLFCSIFTRDWILLAVPTIIAAMPAAVNAPLIAQEYGGNEILASRLMFVTTLFSLVTLPAALIFIKLLVTV